MEAILAFLAFAILFLAFVIYVLSEIKYENQPKAKVYIKPAFHLLFKKKHG